MNSMTWKPIEKCLNSYVTGLHLRNSLSHSEKLVEFFPMEEKTIKWYMCGPTVYDASHLGHARTYLSFDMIRRVLRDYFNYNVVLCMNVTDIDDKIIKRSNEVNENFSAFAKKWESEFFNDMSSLNIDLPDIIIRVSEVVPEITEFVQKIIQNGYAYESNGSVYMDVNKYREAHVYPKLEPSSFTNKKLLEEGEGVLEGPTETEKRSPNDFVLWKKSKPNEPKWSSPWGEGRPGWHIECSAMVNYAFKGAKTIDLHSGGVDLRFPHHDNEIAQSEAYHDHDQWINYFIHSGHLNINGLKMSKSLKNFFTIKDILTEISPRQMRLMFALHKYDTVMDYDAEKSLPEAQNIDKYLTEFMLNIRVILRDRSKITNNQKWIETDFKFQDELEDLKKKIDAAFKENFDFPTVIRSIQNFIGIVYKYSKEAESKYTLIKASYDFIVNSFRVMGLFYESSEDQKLNEKKLELIIDGVAKFRDSVRSSGRTKDVTSILQACDDLRDKILPPFGIRLEDKAPGEPSIWKFDDPVALMKEIQKKNEEKLAKLKEKEERQRQAEEKARIVPKEMFLKEYEGYTFDEKGIPTQDKAGKPVAPKLRTKLEKDYEKQEKVYLAYIESKSKENKQIKQLF